MSTVGELIDRCYRDWLHAGDDQPLRVLLSADIDAAVTVIPLDVGLLAADEQDALAIGTVVEVGLERMLVRDVDLDVPEVTVVRGFEGTEAVAHDDGDIVVIQPAFSRLTVFEAICDGVDGLYPDVWRVVTSEVTTGATPSEVPAEAFTVLSFRYLDGSTVVESSPTLLRDYPGSATGAAVVVSGAPSGRAGWLTFRAEFTRPTSEDDSLQALGVRPEWERIVLVSAVSNIVAGTPELAPVTQEWITQQLPAETFPVGSPGRLAERMIRVKHLMLAEARRQLEAREPHPVHFLSAGI